jgi:hypothetical protein
VVAAAAVEDDDGLHIDTERETRMYHPTTLTTMAEHHTDDLMREAAGTLRAHRPRRVGGSTAGGGMTGGMLASHPRLVTTVVALLVAFGLTNLL